jgi:hypothetical protein
MKSSYLGAGFALACALGLAACGGGGSGDILLGGSVIGLTKDGLVLQNNGGSDLTVAAGASSFYFTNLIATDSNYDVTVKSSPSNASCVVNNGKGNSGAFNVSSVVVVCTTFTHALGGTVSGVTGNNFAIVNGSDRETIQPGATTFQMQKVAEDAPYGITILTQPDGQTCSIANGVGKMGTADINNVQISCVPAA